MSTTVELSPELIEEFVISAHSDFPKVQEMLEREPRLLNEKWVPFDENALEASGHMGRADIMEYLLGKGAPITIFAAASLGRPEEVAAFLQERPELATDPGRARNDHSISRRAGRKSGDRRHAGGEWRWPGCKRCPPCGGQLDRREMVEWLLARDADPNILIGSEKPPSMLRCRVETRKSPGCCGIGAASRARRADRITRG